MDLQDIDQEQEYVRPPNPNMPFNITSETPIKSKTLCIAFYGISSLFASTLITTNKPIASINFQRAKQKSLASVYMSEDSSKVFIIFNENFEAMKEIHLADFITSKFVFEEVIILMSKAKGLLEKESQNNCRCIATSHWKNNHEAKYLEGIAGPEADLIVWAELNSVPLICFVGIYSDYEMNREIVDSIFGKLDGKYGLESKQDISAQIKKYNNTKYSNKLYL